MLVNTNEPINIWIDDLREPPLNYAWCKNYDRAIKTIKYCLLFGKGIGHISFDHDLGEEKSGYDIAKYLVENQINVTCFSVHSANPVGKFNIEQLLLHYGYNKM